MLSTHSARARALCLLVRVLGGAVLAAVSVEEVALALDAVECFETGAMESVGMCSKIVLIVWRRSFWCCWRPSFLHALSTKL